MNHDKSLIEVWKWKDEVSDFLKHLSIKERLEYLRKSARTRLEEKNKLQAASHARSR